MHTRDTRRATRLATLLIAALGCSPVLAQTPAASGPAPGGQIPRPDQLEPGVDTSKSVPAAPPSAPAASADTASAPSAPPPPARTPGAASSVAPKGAPAAKTPARKGPDRLELEATDVTGNSELPKVLYIVPWKRSDLGDMVGRPVNSLLDEVLQPLDRDVFKRENRYYEALKPEGAAAKSDAAQGSGVKP